MNSIISFTSAVNQLQEMFPDHNYATIASTLREKNGNIESAINKLLNSASDKGIVQKRTSLKGKKDDKDKKDKLIFPSDFLRWPKTKEYIRVFEDVASYEHDPNIDPIASLGIKEVDINIEKFKPSLTAASWEGFKVKYSRSNYSHL